MLASISLDRAKVYIANVVPWRPPGNRTPTPQETAMCLPFTRRQIELVAPDYLVCLGIEPARALLDVKDPLPKARGRAYEYDLGAGRRLSAFVTLNPNYLLRQPLHKRHAWADLRALKKATGGL
jgi:DNA polymerase